MHEAMHAMGFDNVSDHTSIMYPESLNNGAGQLSAGDAGTGRSRDGSRVHCRFARRRRSPTLSLRHRHGHPVALHRGLPVNIHMPTSEFPAELSAGYAAHPAHIHQIGAGKPLRAVLTLVPRVLLFVTLAEPTPSGSPGASRLSQGCSHPLQHLLKQAALSFTALLRQGRRRRSLTSTQIVSASRRTWIQAKSHCCYRCIEGNGYPSKGCNEHAQIQIHECHGGTPLDWGVPRGLRQRISTIHGHQRDSHAGCH